MLEMAFHAVLRSTELQFKEGSFRGMVHGLMEGSEFVSIIVISNDVYF